MDARFAPSTLVNPSWQVRHLSTEGDRAAITGLRAAVAPNKGSLRGVAARPVFRDIIEHTSAPEAVSYREDRVGDIPGWWCEPDGAAPDRVIVHFHGGWFNWGSAKAFRHLGGHVARSANARVFIPDYRLAPEHTFPAATMDSVACLDALLRSDARALAVTGDSAGGNLALSALACLSSRSKTLERRLVGAVVFSPITDLTLNGASWSSRADVDPFFVKDQATELVTSYLAGHDPSDPTASPLFAELSGFPPVRVHVGDAEVLLDDSLRWVERAVAVGIDARVEIWDDMPHGFIGSVGQLQAADAALEVVGAFLAKRFASNT